MQHETFAPGELISDRFRIVRLIARGGMGEVYEAHDQILDDMVALKVVGGAAGWQDDAVLQAFRREVQLARRVTHPNVCRVYDVFLHQRGEADLTFVSMELLRGDSLAAHLARHGRLGVAEALPIAQQMIRGLAAAHAAGVVHRDFKSGNVLLVPYPDDPARPPRVVVTDFGVALPVDHHGATATDGTAGTAAYMAPEQVVGREVTTSCDIYALGVVLYEMVTGVLPHAGRSPLQVASRRLEEPPPTPLALVPDLDPRWNAAILRCLQLEPGHRFPSATAVLVALGDEATRATRSAGGASGRDRRTVVLGVLLAAATIAVGVLALGPRRTPPSAGPPSPVQISTWPGLELDPAFAPDGRGVAFAADRSGAFEIFTQPLTPGAVATQITSEGRQCFHPSWSPDGATIAYFAASGDSGIWLVPAAGGPSRRLTDFGAHPAWSPDGSLIAFQSDARAQLAANSNDALPPSTLWLASVADGSVRALTLAGQPAGGHGAPAWSPDGTRLFFSSSDRRRARLWAIELATSRLTEVVADPAICLQPTCAPDGETLYFSAVTSGERYGVWRVPIAKDGRASGPPVIVLNLGSAIIRHLALDASGRRMVYSALATASNLWSLPVDPQRAAPTGLPTPLTTGTGRNNRPVFSPDGAAIAFDRWHVGVNRSIWLMAADGSGLRQLTLDDDTNTHPSWFPDGRRLAFLSGSGDGWGLWEMAVAGGAKTRLAALPPDAAFVTLSPDGSRVAYHTSNGGAVVNLWVAATDGSGARQLSFESEPAAFPIWSPDSRRLACELMHGDDAYLAVMAADGGELTTLVAEPGDSWPFSFSPDGAWIAFAGKRDEYWNLYAVSATGELRPLTTERRLNAYLRYPAWSPRGDRLVYELAETTGDVWLLESLP